MRSRRAPERLNTSASPTVGTAIDGGEDLDALRSLYQDLLGAHGRLQEEVRRRTVALAAAAHELRTPLAVISGYVELLLGQKSGHLNDRQRRILTDVQSNCLRLQRYIRDFLDYTTLDAGKITMYPELSDLSRCLSEVYQIWLPRFQQSEIALFLRVNPDLGPFVFDYYKIQQVVSNLLDNALKFTPPAGSVWLSAETYIWERRSFQSHRVFEERRREISTAPNSVRVTVADTGPGIEPEYHLEIFDDFFKLPIPKEESGGAGLGLAIARRLVRGHEGKIWVESEPGFGSKFCFILPYQVGEGGPDE